MTNDEIILEKQYELLHEGKIGTMTIRGHLMPEPIHTRRRWKELGYKVKKGEKPIAKFEVWRTPKTRVVADAEGDLTEEAVKSTMRLEMAEFYAYYQVEELAVPTSQQPIKPRRRYPRFLQ